MIMAENECTTIGILLHCLSVRRWLPLVLCIQRIGLCSPIIGDYIHRKIQKFQKGEPFSAGGGYIITNPRCILFTPTNPSYTYNKPMYIPMLHTPIQTMVYTNVIYFCSIHNTYKPMYHLYVLKPYISIHMYYAIEYTIVIYNRLQQLRYICYIHNPLYV